MTTNKLAGLMTVGRRTSRAVAFGRNLPLLSSGLLIAFVLRIFIIGIVTCMFCKIASGERIPLKRPEITIDMGDTSKDWEQYDFEKKKYVFQDSHATVRRDAQTGDFLVDYYGPKGEKKYMAAWTPLSQFALTVEGNVTVAEIGEGFRYDYTLSNAENSVQTVRRFILTKTSLPDKFDLPSKKWEFLRIWKGSGKFVCLRPDGNELRGVEPGETLYGFSFVSPLLPAVLEAKAIGYGETFLRNYSPYEEVPYSVERAFTPYLTTNDCVSGKVVGPGAAAVQIEALYDYFETSIEQGWLEVGAYRDEVKALLVFALSAHELRKTAQVLRTLTTIQEKVSAVYAQEDSPMLSEAYALLHFNIDYLLANYEKDLAVKDAAE